MEPLNFCPNCGKDTIEEITRDPRGMTGPYRTMGCYSCGYGWNEDLPREPLLTMDEFQGVTPDMKSTLHQIYGQQ